MKTLRFTIPVLLVCATLFFLGCDGRGREPTSSQAPFLRDRFSEITYELPPSSACAPAASSAASSRLLSSQASARPSGPVLSNETPSDITSNPAAAASLGVKITPEQAQASAYKKAVELSKTFAVWKGASPKLFRVSLLTFPLYKLVIPLDELIREDEQREYLPCDTPVYVVQYEDQNTICSQLTLYVDARNGKVIGGDYMGD